jgi:hypothetical protein
VFFSRIFTGGKPRPIRGSISDRPRFASCATALAGLVDTPAGVARMNRPAHKVSAGKEKPVSKLKIALVGLLAAATGLPLGIGKTDTQRTASADRVAQSITRSANETKQAPAQAPSAAGQSINLVRGLDGMEPTPLPLRSGRTPKEYGMSRECAKQRRKNKLRRLGIGGYRR